MFIASKAGLSGVAVLRMRLGDWCLLMVFGDEDAWLRPPWIGLNSRDQLRGGPVHDFLAMILVSFMIQQGKIHSTIQFQLNLKWNDVLPLQ